MTQTALFNRVRDELSRRTSKRLDVGERVVIERAAAKKESKDGRSYWPFTVMFPDRPEKSTDDLFDLDQGPVKYKEAKRPEEPAPGDVGPDGDIPF